MSDEIIKKWAESESFTVWLNDHSAVLRNLAKWLNKHYKLDEDTFATEAKAEALIEQWISVKDRLPPEYTNVLVCNSGGVVELSADEREPCIAYFDKESGWSSIAWWNYDLWERPIVTHWMLLPEPPAITGGEL